MRRRSWFAGIAIAFFSVAGLLGAACETDDEDDIDGTEDGFEQPFETPDLGGEDGIEPSP